MAAAPFPCGSRGCCGSCRRCLRGAELPASAARGRSAALGAAGAAVASQPRCADTLRFPLPSLLLKRNLDPWREGRGGEEKALCITQCQTDPANHICAQGLVGLASPSPELSRFRLFVLSGVHFFCPPPVPSVLRCDSSSCSSTTAGAKGSSGSWALLLFQAGIQPSGCGAWSAPSVDFVAERGVSSHSSWPQLLVLSMPWVG